jgi:hypothetical protein
MISCSKCIKRSAELRFRSYILSPLATINNPFKTRAIHHPVNGSLFLSTHKKILSLFQFLFFFISLHEFLLEIERHRRIIMKLHPEPRPSLC